jgi:hypothetical protein
MESPTTAPPPRRRAAAAAALAAATPLLLVALLAALPTPSQAINLQTVNLCNCITPACTTDIAPSGGTLACFVNITSCNYFLAAEPKNNLYRKGTIHVDATGRPWDYCQQPFSDQTKRATPPALADITTIEGCKCLSTFYTAYGRRYDDSCSDSVTGRAPFCYVWPPSCPEGVTLQKSSFYPGYFTGFCQSKEKPEAGEKRSRGGCQCLQEYRYYNEKVTDGRCINGQKALAGKKFCYVDPSTCPPATKATRSSLYEGWFFDLCD